MKSLNDVMRGKTRIPPVLPNLLNLKKWTSRLKKQQKELPIQLKMQIPPSDNSRINTSFGK